MKINRIYTKRGDLGETGIVGGGRVAKDSARIEAYGSIDELQAFLGVLRANIREAVKSRPDPFLETLIADLLEIQNDIFDIGNEFATPEDRKERIRNPISEGRIRFLEERIDSWKKDIPELRTFVFAGGGRLSSLGHFARTLSRRVERNAVTLSRESPQRPECLAYLNRLSDYLFVLARRLAVHLGEEEPLWRTPLEPLNPGSTS